MRFEPGTSQTQVQSITSSASLVINWKRPLRSLGCKWQDNVTEGCGCVHGIAQPQDQTVAGKLCACGYEPYISVHDNQLMK